MQQIQDHHKQQFQIIDNWESNNENTLQKLDKFLNQQYIYGLASHLAGVIDGYTDIATQAEQLYVEFKSKLFGNKHIKECIQNAQCHSQPEQRFKEELLRDFRDQPEDLLKEFSKLSNDFNENIKQDQATNFLIIKNYKPEMLNGLSESIKSYIIKGNELKLDSTAFVSQNINKYAESDELRKMYWEWNQTRCMKNNEVAEQQLLLKQKIAEFFNKKNICEKNLEDKMAKNPETVENFLNQIKSIAMNKYLEDGKLLEKTFNQEVTPWNINFLIEKMKKLETNFDTQQFDHYFEQQRTLDKIFEFLQQKYNVEMIKTQQIGWHQDVQCFEIKIKDSHSNQNQKQILYFDPYQREFKRPGAWMDTIGQDIVVVCTNLPPKQEKHNYIPFGEIETILHEFGHAFHYIMSNTELQSQRGTNVAWDFVEVPSQFNENFASQREFLDLVGLDENGQKVPEELRQQLIKSKRFMNSHFVMTQVMYGTIDFRLHFNQDWNKEVSDEHSSKIDKYCTKILQSVRYPYKYGETHEIKTIYRHFSHIFSSVGGYTCGYYGYFWADVIQAHLFKFMDQHKDFKTYIEKILKPGDSIDPNELIKNYCGGFDFEAWKEIYVQIRDYMTNMAIANITKGMINLLLLIIQIAGIIYQREVQNVGLTTTILFVQFILIIIYILQYQYKIDIYSTGLYQVLVDILKYIFFVKSVKILKNIQNNDTKIYEWIIIAQFSYYILFGLILLLSFIIQKIRFQIKKIQIPSNYQRDEFIQEYTKQILNNQTQKIQL